MLNTQYNYRSLTIASIAIAATVALTAQHAAALETPLVDNYGQYLAQQRAEDVAFSRAVNAVASRSLGAQQVVDDLLDNAHDRLAHSDYPGFVTAMHYAERCLARVRTDTGMSCTTQQAELDRLLAAGARAAIRLEQRGH